MARRERSVIVATILLAAMGIAGQAATDATAHVAANAPAVVADATKAPKVAPDLPLTSSKDATERTVAPKDDLAALGDGEAPRSIQEGPWKALRLEQRRMLIMGSSDGFAAAGQGAPCFPGRDAQKLDQELLVSGFGDANPERLPEALARIGTTNGCAAANGRTYGSGYLMKISNEDLAIYLTAAIRAYARMKPCQPELQSHAAILAVAAIGLADDEDDPIVPLGIALAQGCAKPSK